MFAGQHLSLSNRVVPSVEFAAESKMNRLEKVGLTQINRRIAAAAARFIAKTR